MLDKKEHFQGATHLINNLKLGVKNICFHKVLYFMMFNAIFLADNRYMQAPGTSQLTISIEYIVRISFTLNFVGIAQGAVLTKVQKASEDINSHYVSY